MGHLSPPPVSADLDGYNRPYYDRQRSYSAPEFRVIDVTATEAVMICSAAATASDRRRRRRNRNHASLDVELEGTISRAHPPTDSETIPEEQEQEYEPVFDSEPEPEPELEPSCEDEPSTPGSALSTYAHTMAGFMQQQISAIRHRNLPPLDTSTCWTSPMLSIPDDHLCSSPPMEYDEKEVMEITPSNESSFEFLRPQVKSTFSAWSSAAPSPISPDPPTTTNSGTEVTSYFNFPEPPKSGRVDSVSSSYLQSTLSRLEADLIDNEPEDEVNSPVSDPTPTAKRPASAKSIKANKRRTTTDHVFLTNFDVEKQPTPTRSPPIRNCGQFFPSGSAPQQGSPATPYQGPIKPIHHVC